MVLPVMAHLPLGGCLPSLAVVDMVLEQLAESPLTVEDIVLLLGVQRSGIGLLTLERAVDVWKVFRENCAGGHSCCWEKAASFCIAMSDSRSRCLLHLDGLPFGTIN